MKQKVFIDSCCLFSAINSPDGGSGEIIKMAENNDITIVITDNILEETTRNIKNKLSAVELITLNETLLFSNTEIFDSPTMEEKSLWKEVTVEKDLHVLAGAIKTKADFLITLDKKHILTDKVKQAYPIPIMTPGDFLRQWVINQKEKNENKR